MATSSFIYTCISPKKEDSKSLTVFSECSTITPNRPCFIMVLESIAGRFSLFFGGGGGVLQISSDGDDRMGAKVKAQKIPGPNINPQKLPCRISEPYTFPERIK